ncbi:L-seryl-tRNA(Sec) kinase-like isoform X2 [Haliotis rufescens]|nr:L-seryl-tRNA(Sec) kinase-like isoform X2 [Haliotis rufescens]XP_046362360.2 L-seryl-tRNA(Sec) kinase-like isoform X2 [Haliotis rufescens]XP_046362362.2 L-seryl-tRNA(Sec) kinase-like isoform X2 [Haliotis rufescens]
MPGCVMVMCGLPASGKTTLVSQFATSVSEEFRCHVVDYDKLMPPHTEKQLIDHSAQVQDVSLWKKYREGIICCVDRLLDTMKAPHPDSEQDKQADTHHRDTHHTGTDTYHTGTDTYHTGTETHQADAHHTGTDTYHTGTDTHHTDTQHVVIPQSHVEASTLLDDSTEPTSQDSNRPGASGTLWRQFITSLGLELDTKSGLYTGMVVVIDDNMYYRSMRYDYYQLARKYGLGFCEVHVDCPSDMAVARNKQRTLGRVEDNVIVTMATKMEVPDSAAFHWEKYSLSITHDTRNGCCRMRSLMKAAMLDPVQAVVEDVAGKEESRRRCSENVIHQTDQILRKLLAIRMKSAKEAQLSKANLRSLSTKLIEVKSALLAEMRSGHITVAVESQDASKDEESELFQFVKKLFESRLAPTS